MANTLLTSTAITNEALEVLVNSLALGSRVSRKYDNRYGVDGAKIGYTLSIRKPPRFLGTSGPGLGIEDITDQFVNLTLTNQDHVDTGITMADLRLSMVSFRDQYIKPAVAALANKVDLAISTLYQQVQNFVGAVGTVPADLDVYLNAGAQLDNNSAPADDERYMVINPQMQAKIVFALRGLFNPQGTIGKQFLKGAMGDAIGFGWAKDQNVYTHTVGLLGGTPVVATGGQTGSTINTSGWTASVVGLLNAGDIITFDGVYQVNVQNRLSLNILQQFTVTATVNSDGAGLASIPIYPPLVPAGAFQTVSATALANAAVKVFGIAAASQSTISGALTPQGLAFHRNAFALACCDLEIPGGVDMSGRAKDDELGLSIRFIRAYDPSLDRVVSRLDILYGVVATRPEEACRVIS